MNQLNVQTEVAASLMQPFCKLNIIVVEDEI